MILPTRDRPRLKHILRLRQDLWGNLLQKNLWKKKWRDLRQRLQEQQSFLQRRKKKKNLPHFRLERLVNSKWYRPRKRYAFREGLLKQQAFKYYYGCSQDYKIKLAFLRTRSQGWLGFSRRMESHLSIALYNLHLVSTVGESRTHFRKKRVLLQGSSNPHYLEPGSILSFPANFHSFIRRRFLQREGWIHAKHRRKTLPSWMDVDPQSLRVLVFQPIQPLHLPFFLDFKKVWRWYRQKV